MLDELIKEPFLGFYPETLKFLKSLTVSKNNNKEWFSKHRDQYENYVKQPMRNLIDVLSTEFRKIDSQIVINYKSIFRINRDIRFSKDKTPYKKHISASFCFNTIKAPELPQFYFHISPKEVLVAAGMYQYVPEKIKKIKNKIYNDFDLYKSIITKTSFSKKYEKIHGNKFDKVPREFSKIIQDDSDPLLIESFKMKQFYVEKYYDSKTCLEPTLVEILCDHFKEMKDFLFFLYKAVK